MDVIRMVQEFILNTLTLALAVQTIFGFTGLRRERTLAIRIFALLGVQIGIGVALVTLVILFPPPPNGDALEMGVALMLLIGYLAFFVWFLIVPNLVFCGMVVLRLIKLKQPA